MIDELTGLPELPEGYFWRIYNRHKTESFGDYPGVEVALMKHSTKLRWFKLVPTVREIESAWKYRDRIQPGGVPDAIQEIAKKVYKMAYDQLPVHQEIDAEIAKYAGDYPPKKLGG